MDIIAYTYITINMCNGKLYIGFHKHNGFDKNYKGSGSLIRKAFDKYGWDNFKCYMVRAFDNIAEALNHESYLIDTYNAVEDPRFYNLVRSYTGNRHYKVIDDDGNEIIVSAEEAHKFKDNGPVKANYPSSMGLIWANDGTTNYMIPPQDLEGSGLSKGMTDDHNEKCGATVRGKVSMHFEDQEGYFFVPPDQVEDFERKGAVRGKGPLTSGRIRINNGTEEILVYPEELSDPKYDGWVRGDIRSEHTYNHVCATKGKKAMHWDNPDGTTTSFFVPEDEVEKLLQEGAKMGRGITTTKGLTYVNDGIRNKMVPPDKVSEMISQGYRPGKLSVRWFAIKGDEIKKIGLRQVPKYKELGYDIKEETITEEVVQ